MKNVFRQAVIIALAAAIGFSMTACDDSDSGGSSGGNAKNRISFVSENYELIIEKGSGRSAYTPATGDKYRLMDGKKKVSWGDVEVSGNDYTFTPVKAGQAEEFTATMAVDKSGIKITSQITLNDGTNASIQNLSMNWGPAGTWLGRGKTEGVNWTSTIFVTGSFEGGTYEFKVFVGDELWESDSGTYTTEGNTFVAYSSGSTNAVARSSLVDANTLRVTLTKEAGYMAGTYTYKRQGSN